MEFNERRLQKVMAKDLKVGRIYLDKNKKQLAYAGQFPYVEKCLDDTKDWTKQTFSPKDGKKTNIFLDLETKKIVIPKSVPTEIKIDTLTDVDSIADIVETVFKDYRICEKSAVSFEFKQINPNDFCIKKSGCDGYSFPSRLIAKIGKDYYLICGNQSPYYPPKPQINAVAIQPTFPLVFKSIYYNQNDILTLDINDIDSFHLLFAKNSNDVEFLPFESQIYFPKTALTEKK